VNAIEYAARLITHVRRLADTEASFGHHQPLYDVPFTTLQTGTISGGTANNIVPKDCEFTFSAAGCREMTRSALSIRCGIMPTICCWKCVRWHRRRNQYRAACVARHLSHAG
jgi:hypothetical protein